MNNVLNYLNTIFKELGLETFTLNYAVKDIKILLRELCLNGYLLSAIVQDTDVNSFLGLNPQFSGLFIDEEFNTFVTVSKNQVIDHNCNKCLDSDHRWLIIHVFGKMNHISALYSENDSREYFVKLLNALLIRLECLPLTIKDIKVDGPVSTLQEHFDNIEEYTEEKFSVVSKKYKMTSSCFLNSNRDFTGIIESEYIGKSGTNVKRALSVFDGDVVYDPYYNLESAQRLLDEDKNSEIIVIEISVINPKSRKIKNKMNKIQELSEGEEDYVDDGYDHDVSVSNESVTYPEEDLSDNESPSVKRQKLE